MLGPYTSPLKFLLIYLGQSLHEFLLETKSLSLFYYFWLKLISGEKRMTIFRISVFP